MEEKLSFVLAYLRGEWSMSALCEEYGISRKTGYKWVSRYWGDGLEGLVERSRAPRRPARAMAPEVVEAIIELRRGRPHWGPRKLRAVLMAERPEVVWPAASTMGDLLRAEGLVTGRRRRRRVEGVSRPFREVRGPNDVWSIDFKGWFRTGDGARCDPLTITDAYSRYVLACVIVAPRTEAGRRCAECLSATVFRARCVRTTEFRLRVLGAGGLSRLSVEWVKAGIAVERIEPGQPQQNGRHERMHRTLKEETVRPPAMTVEDQQARFDRFREDFNARRPHEALGQRPPAALYRRSLRRYPERLEEPWYDADHAVRRVRSDGAIKWGGELVFVSETLTRRWALPRPPAGSGWCASRTWNSGSSIGGRRSFIASVRPGRAARKRHKTGTLSPMYPVYSVTYLSGPTNEEQVTDIFRHYVRSPGPGPIPGAAENPLPHPVEVYSWLPLGFRVS